MINIYRKRQLRTLLFVLVMLVIGLVFNFDQFENVTNQWSEYGQYELGLNDKLQPDQAALDLLETLAVKGRAPKTGYKRSLFSNGWGKIGDCDVRNVILKRDLSNLKLRNCLVLSGTLIDPYSNQTINFQRGPKTSFKVQIDHVVAVGDAWQKGAQQLSPEQRYQFYNDPLNLLAVSEEANQHKLAGDAATWLPKNKAFRCDYVKRQIQVKAKYNLWVTPAEKAAIKRQLQRCKTKT